SVPHSEKSSNRGPLQMNALCLILWDYVNVHYVFRQILGYRKSALPRPAEIPAERVPIMTRMNPLSRPFFNSSCIALPPSPHHAASVLIIEHDDSSAALLCEINRIHVA